MGRNTRRGDGIEHSGLSEGAVQLGMKSGAADGLQVGAIAETHDGDEFRFAEYGIGGKSLGESGGVGISVRD